MSTVLLENHIFTIKREKKIVIFLHIYGIRAIIVLFCDHHDTKLEKLEI